MLPIVSARPLSHATFTSPPFLNQLIRRHRDFYYYASMDVTGANVAQKGCKCPANHTLRMFFDLSHLCDALKMQADHYASKVLFRQRATDGLRSQDGSSDFLQGDQ